MLLLRKSAQRPSTDGTDDADSACRRFERVDR